MHICPAEANFPCGRTRRQEKKPYPEVWDGSVFLLVRQQVAVHADHKAIQSAGVKRLREGRGASKMFSAQTHMHACSHTHPVCTYIIITRGGALQNVRIADSYCNRDDFKRNSNIGMIQSWHTAVSVKTLNCCSPGQSMRILPGWFTGAGTWL